MCNQILKQTFSKFSIFSETPKRNFLGPYHPPSLIISTAPWTSRAGRSRRSRGPPRRARAPRRGTRSRGGRRPKAWPRLLSCKITTPRRGGAGVFFSSSQPSYLLFLPSTFAKHLRKFLHNTLPCGNYLGCPAIPANLREFFDEK